MKSRKSKDKSNSSMFSKKNELSPAENPDHIFKLHLVGDAGIGKSCFLLRFTDDEYKESYLSTIGIDVKNTQVRLADANIKLQIWDMPGQERFKGGESTYYYGSHAAFVFFDLTHRLSFDNIDRWIDHYSRSIAKIDRDKCLIVLIGTKSDLVAQRDISQQDIDTLLKKHPEIKVCIQTSAKDNLNVDAAFESMATLLIEKYQPVKAISKVLDKDDKVIDGMIEKINDAKRKFEQSDHADNSKSKDKLAVLNQTIKYLQGKCSIEELRGCISDHTKWDHALGSSIFATSAVRGLVEEAVKIKGDSLQGVSTLKIDTKP